VRDVIPRPGLTTGIWPHTARHEAGGISVCGVPLARLADRYGTPAYILDEAGRYCEADVLARDVPLPADIRPGDLIAVPGTGAYHHSMASSYNLVGRPPVVAVHRDAARLLIRRETESDLLRRDIGR